MVHCSCGALHACLPALTPLTTALLTMHLPTCKQAHVAPNNTDLCKTVSTSQVSKLTNSLQRLQLSSKDTRDLLTCEVGFVSR